MPLVVVLITTLWIGLGFAALLSTICRTPRAASAGTDASPVTILKPLAGVDESLFENLESFFVQDYPSFEILFGLADPQDPAIGIVRRLQAKYPHVRSTIVVDPKQTGINPKVANLRAMVRFAANDLIIISDSNVRVPRGYIREAVSELSRPPAHGGERPYLGRTGTQTRPVGLVTHAFAGVGEETLGALFENVQLNGFIAAGAALPTVLENAAVVGKSMLFSRSLFERLGGFESVAGVLAEDFLIGKMFEHAGYDVRIAPTVIASVNGRVTMRAFLARQLRWSMLRFRLNPLAFLLEPSTSPIAMLPFALAAFGSWAFVWAAALVALREGGQWALLRGRKRVLLAIVLGPARDLLMLGIWLVTPFVKHVSWRGHRVRLGAGTRAFIRVNEASGVR